MNFAPVALFVYNRPTHTQKTVEALLSNELSEKTDLIIYSDAAKNEASIEKVNEVRQYIKSIKGFNSIRIVEQERNIGLAASIINGVTDVIKDYGRAIVLEDDLVTSPFFLTYMNKGLNLYQEEEDVISIHAYNYPINFDIGQKSFFLKGADCWGWATWKRGWELFEQDGQKLLAQIRSSNLISDFNFNGSYPYDRMLKDQINGKNDSWAIRWYASAFLKNKYTLYPAKALVYNIGLDSSGTHSGNDVQFNEEELSNEDFYSLEKISVAENQEVKKRIEQFFRKSKKIGFKQRIINLIS